METDEPFRRVCSGSCANRVRAAILVYQCNGIAAILVSQTHPAGIDLYFRAKIVRFLVYKWELNKEVSRLSKCSLLLTSRWE